MSAPADDAVTSTGLDSSRLSAAFGAAISAANDDAATATGSEGNIDVGEGHVETLSIPGVNPGTPVPKTGRRCMPRCDIVLGRRSQFKPLYFFV